MRQDRSKVEESDRRLVDGILRHTRPVGSAACVCGEINTRHCPVHGQDDATTDELVHRVATTAVALLHHDDTCRDFACLMRDGCPERQTLMDAHNEATNDYARLVEAVT